ncbi:MAG TPA: 2-oxoacid:acceptor oxidoreductase family protein [Thermodesulfobacteriota bacterium]|nr:2-oxoacid:acceptor oxidoreductase family protein [Thermodesulfobacteriota bacterium]
MAAYIEIRWHGRAQQGIVTAAKMVGESCLRSGKYVQAFPEFGPERMGAPVAAYNRVSDEPIRLHCRVTEPKYVLIADSTLIGMALSGGMESSGGVTDGATDDAVFIVNTPKLPDEMRKELGLKSKGAKVYTLDASKISLETIGRNMPNTPMLGALAKVTNVVMFDALIDNFKDNYSKKFSPKVIEGNITAMNRGFQEVKGE